MTVIDLDLVVDLNTMDESGLPWAFLDEGPHPERVIPGHNIVVGSGAVRAVATVVDIDQGIVHVRPFPGSVTRNANRLSPNRQAS